MKFVLKNKEIELSEEELEGILKLKETKKEKAKPDWGHIPTEYNPDETMVLDGVKYHRHSNGGGWVSGKAKVDDTVWVGFFAVVHNGVIKDQAIIHDRAIINCDGLQEGTEFNIGDKAQISGSAWVSGSAQVYGSAMVYGEGCLLKSTNKDIELKNWETIK